jgi:hypothetical protein
MATPRVRAAPSILLPGLPAAVLSRCATGTLVHSLASERFHLKSPHLWRVAFMSLTAVVGGVIVAFAELSLI